MNKQEALEALLSRMRGWEQEGAEVPARNSQWVRRLLGPALERVQKPLGEVDLREALITIGAVALYLLRDEVDVVEVSEAEAIPASARPINGAMLSGASPIVVHYAPPPSPPVQVVVLGPDGRVRRG